MTRRPEPGQPITIQMAGQTFTLLYPLRILHKMHSEQGISPMGGMREIGESPEKLAIVLHYGLMKHHPDVSLEWVEDNVDGTSLMELLPTIIYACTGLWQENEHIKELDRQRSPNEHAQAGDHLHGSRSGLSDDTTYALVNGRSGI